MTQVLKMSRKALTVGIVLTTLAWSMMATVLVAPLKASAAGCTSGSLIKGSLAAVYYCGSDGKRYVFTNDKAYFTWYGDFSGVMIISDADLATIQIGGNVTYRPGVKMLKIQSDPKVYAIAHGGVLRPIASEAVAACLYGSTWNRQIDDVSDAFFTNYTVGAPINNCTDYDRNAEMSSSQTINQDKNLTSSVSGNLQTSLASDNPSSRTIPAGATSVNFLKFNLHNASSDATVTNLTLHRVGPGATTDIAAVYLYEGAARLTSGRSVNSSTNDVSFTGLNWMIAAGQTRTFWVAVDIAAAPNAGAVHAFQVASIQAGSATVGGLPIVGNNMTLTTTLVGSLQVDKSGSITNPKVGQLAAKVAEFKVQAGSTEDVWLNRITLFQGGSLAASNLTNLKLTQAGNTVATTSGIDSKLHAVFNLAAPMLIEKGASKTFEVWADISGATRAGDSLKLYVEENSDVYGVGATYGYGVRVTRPTFDGSDGADAGTEACNSSTDNCSYSTVDGGQLTISFNGPSSQNLASNSKDREVFNFTLASQANVEIKKLVLVVDCGPATTIGGCTHDTNDTANYTDIKVTNTATNQVWWGPQDLSGTGSDTQQTLTFNDVQDLAAGSSQTFKVTLDINSAVPTSDTVKVTLVAFGGSDVRNLDNNTFVATGDIVPSGNIAGNQHTIVAPSLTVSLASTPVSQSFVKGSVAVPFVGINLQSGDGTDVKVTALTVTGFIDSDGVTSGIAMIQGFDDNTGDVAVSDDILSCKLWDGTTQVGDAKSPSVSSTEGSGGTMQFTNLNLTVASAATKTLTLKCDTSNSAFRDGNSEIVGFSVQTSTDVSAQDPDGNSVTTSGSANATAASIRITITDAGTVTTQLAPDDSESEASLVVAGNQSAVLAKWRFTAANEELKLVKLTTFLDNATARRSLTSVSLYDGATLLAGPVALTTTDNTNGSASSTALFSGMNLVIPKDGSKTVTLKGSLNTIANGGMTGDNVKMRLYIPGSDSATNTSAFEARGTSSSTVIRTLATSGTTITAGNDKLVRKTKPTVSLASLPTSTLVAGTVVASRFTVTADAAENLSLKKLSFKAQISAGVIITPNSPAVREVGQGTDISGTGTAATGGTNCGFTADGLNNCVRVVFSSEQVITAGTSKTFELRFTVTGLAGASSVSTTILGDTVDAVGELDTGAGGLAIATGIDAVVTGTDGEYNFLWSDNNQIPHNGVVAASMAGDAAGSSNDWMNGKFVKVLPGDVQTLSQ